MVYALNDLLASFVFIDCIIVWKFMLKCVLRVRIKIYTNISDCYATGSSGVLRFMTQSNHYLILQ